MADDRIGHIGSGAIGRASRLCPAVCREWVVARVLDGDAIVGGQTRQARIPALADGAELPLLAPQIQLAQHHRRLHTGISHRELDTGYARRIEQVQGQIADVSETHPVRRIEARNDDDRANPRGQGLKVHRDTVLSGFFSCPLAQQTNRTVPAGRGVVEHEVLIRTDPAIRTEQQSSNIDISGAAGI